MLALPLWKNGRAILSSLQQIPIYLNSLVLMRNLLQRLFCMSMISLRFQRLRMNIQPIRGHMWRPNGSIRYPCCSSCVFVWLYITHILGILSSAGLSRSLMLQTGIAIFARSPSNRQPQGSMGPQTTSMKFLTQYYRKFVCTKTGTSPGQSNVYNQKSSRPSAVHAEARGKAAGVVP